MNHITLEEKEAAIATDIRKEAARIQNGFISRRGSICTYSMRLRFEMIRALQEKN